MPQDNDPFKEFGGSVVEEQAQADPFAEFGGSAVEVPIEKKNPVGTPSQDGSEGLQGGQALPSSEPTQEQPLEGLGGQPSNVPASISNPLQAAIDGSEKVELEGVVLPPINDILDLSPSNPSLIPNPKKYSDEFEKAAIEQAGLDPEGVKNKINERARNIELGEVEARIYVVDGKAIPSSKFEDLIYDQKFIEDAQKGLHTVEINPNNSPFVSEMIDTRLAEVAARNLQSGTRTSDKWENLASGLYTVGSGAAGIQSVFHDTMEEILGVNLPKSREVLASEKLSEDLSNKASEQQEKVFQYREDFITSIANGNFSDALQQGGDALSGSIPYSAAAAGLTFAGGPLTAFAVLSPLGVSSEYASAKTSDEEMFKEMSRAAMLERSWVVGPVQAGTDIVAGRAINRSFGLTKQLWKGLVKETAEKAGEEAGDAAARELSKNILRKYGENIGLQMTEEFLAEGGAELLTMGYDDIRGNADYSFSDYFHRISNNGLLGAFSGGAMTAGLGGPAAIYSKGLSVSNDFKRVMDKKLAFDPTGVSDLTEMAQKSPFPNDVKEDIQSNIETREKAVKSVPKDKVGDTELVDLVEKKQVKEEEKKELDPVFQAPITEEIVEIEGQIAKKAGMEAETDKETEVSEKKSTKEETTKEKGRLTKFTSPTDKLYGEITESDGTKRDLSKEEYLALEKQEGVYDVSETVLKEEKPVEELSEKAQESSPKFGKNTFTKEQDSISREITGKNGEKFVLIPYDSRGPRENISDTEDDSITLSVEDYDGNQIGMVSFNKDEGGEYHANNINIQKEHKRNGIGTAIYQYVDSLGVNLRPSKDQTTEGKVFWDSRKKEPTSKAESSFENAQDISDIQEGAVLVNMGDTDVILTEDSNKITLDSIETKDDSKKGKGSAKKALKEVTDKADELGKSIELKVVPKEGTKTTKEGLVKMYQEAGFVEVDGKEGLMRREPKREAQKEEAKPKEETTKKSTEKELRAELQELINEKDRLAENFETDDAVQEKIDAILDQLPETQIDEREFTEEERAEAEEERLERQEEIAKGEMTKDDWIRTEIGLTRGDIKKYADLKAWEESKQYYKGIVDWNDDSVKLDARVEEVSEQAGEEISVQDVIDWADSVATERATKGAYDKKIPSMKARKKAAKPTKRTITADTLRNIAKGIRNGKPKGGQLYSSIVPPQVIAAAMESAAKFIEGTANVLESDIVDHIVEYIRTHPSFKKKPANVRKSFDLRGAVLGEMGITTDDYVESLKKAKKRDERKAKREGEKEGKRKEVERILSHEMLEEEKVESVKLADQELSGIMNELVPEERRGLFEKQRRSVKETMERGRALLDSGGINPVALMQEMLSSPRPLTADETAAMVYYKAQLDSRMEALTKQREEAISNNQYDRLNVIDLHVSEVDAYIDDYYKFQEASGYEQGLSLKMRQLLITKEYELANQIRKYKKETGRKNVPTDVLAKFRMYDEAIRELNKRIEDFEKRSASEGEKIEVLNEPKSEIPKTKSERAKTIAKSVRSKKFVRTMGELNKLQSDPTGLFKVAWDGSLEIIATTIEQGGKIADAIDSAIEHLKESEWYKNLSDKGKKEADVIAKRGLYEESFEYMGVQTPSIKDDVLRIPDEFVRTLIRDGFDNIESATQEAHRIISNVLGLDVSERQVRDAITNYGKTSKLSKEDVEVKLREIKRVGKLISALEDVSKKKRPLRSGRERDKVTKKERELRKQINEFLKDIPQSETEIEEAWKTTLDSTKQRLKNRIEDLKKQLAEGRKTPKKKGIELDAEAEYLKQEADRLTQILRSIEGKPEMSFEQRVRITEMAIERSIKEHERRIKNKDFAPISKTPVSTPKILALRSEREKLKQRYREEYEKSDQSQKDADSAALKRTQAQIDKVTKQIHGEIEIESKKEAKKEYSEHVKQARKTLNSLRDVLKDTDAYKEVAEKRKLEAYKTTMRRGIEEYERRIKNKDFAVRKPAEKVLDEEAKKLKAEQQKWKNNFDVEREKYRLDTRDTMTKIRETLVDVLGIPKAMVASLDFSSMLRQGGMLTARNPMFAKRAAKEMIKQTFSEEAYEQWMNEFVVSEMYAEAKGAGLYIASPNAKLLAKEEQFVSNMAERIPIYGRLIKASERAYSSYLNVMRLSVFSDFKNMIDRSGLSEESKSDAMKDMAKFINNSTGRGSLGDYEPNSPEMNIAFFSPRYVLSRANILMNTATLYAAYHPSVRKEALKTVGTYISLGIAILAMAVVAGADVEDDPRSSDFGKIRIGDLRIDIFAGLIPMIVFFTRMMSGQSKTVGGNVKDLSEGGGFSRNRLDVLGTFIRGKLSPSAGAFVDFYDADRSKTKPWSMAGINFENRVYFKNLVGEEQTLPERAIQMVTPIYTHDMADIYKKEGFLLTAATVGADIVGFGAGYYSAKEFKVKGQAETAHAQEKSAETASKKADKVLMVDKLSKTYKGRFADKEDSEAVLSDEIEAYESKYDAGVNASSLAVKHNVKVLIEKDKDFADVMLNGDKDNYVDAEKAGAAYWDKYEQAPLSSEHAELLNEFLPLSTKKTRGAYPKDKYAEEMAESALRAKKRFGKKQGK